VKTHCVALRYVALRYVMLETSL